MNNILLLASQSPSRQRLLGQIAVPFVLIDQEADESQCDWGLSMPQVVESIAKYKMQHAIMPAAEEGRELFFLTADTLTQAKNGELLPKPLAPENAKRMLRLAKEGVRVGTAFCLEKKEYKFEAWQTKERIITYVESECVYDVPESLMDEYLKNSIGLHASGGITVEGYGSQFFKSIHGSYTSIQGLPLCELRKALEQLDFF